MTDTPPALRSCCAFLLCLAWLSPSLTAQNARPPGEVPSLGGIPTGASFGRYSDVEESLWFAAQTLRDEPGVSYRWSETDGRRWSLTRRRYQDPLSQGLEPTVYVIDEEVFLCWVERTTVQSSVVHTLYGDYSDEEGEVWRGPLPMQPPASSTGSYNLESYDLVIRPRINEPAQIFVVALSSSLTGGSDELVLHRSENTGSSFGTPLRIRSSSAGTIAIDSFDFGLGETELHFAWTEDDGGAGGSDVLYRSYDFSAGNLGAPQLLRVDVEVPEEGLELGVEGDGLGVAWLERDTTGGNSLLLASSGDEGSTFQPPRCVGGPCSISNFADDIQEPAITIDSSQGKATLTWREESAGIFGVFNRTADLGGPGLGRVVQPLRGPAEEIELYRGDPNASQALLKAEVDGVAVGLLSNDAGENWNGLFPLIEVGPGETATLLDVRYEPELISYELDWLVTSATGGRQLMGGFRPQSISVRGGEARAGEGLAFDLSLFPSSTYGLPFQVFLALSPGQTEIPAFGAAIGLELDRLFLTSVWIPELQGVIAPPGKGATRPLSIPIELQGLTIWYAAAAATTSYGLVVTDAFPLTFR